jgi:hypothetical protein
MAEDTQQTIMACEGVALIDRPRYKTLYLEIEGVIVACRREGRWHVASHKGEALTFTDLEQFAAKA